MAVYSGPEIVNSGLAFHIDSANTRSYQGSGTVVTDLVGGLTGSLVNGVAYDGSFIFDGVDDHILFADNNALDTLSPFCIDIWVNPVLTNTLFAKGQYGVHWNYGLKTSGIRHNNGDYGSSYGLVNNQWQNIVVRYDGTKNQIYRNGVLTLDITPGGYTPTQGTGPLAIGRAGGSASEYSSMKLSKFALYKKLLSQAEIQQNFEATRGRYSI